jgi:hypothetical protein
MYVNGTWQKSKEFIYGFMSWKSAEKHEKPKTFDSKIGALQVRLFIHKQLPDNLEMKCFASQNKLLWFSPFQMIPSANQTGQLQIIQM